MKIQIDSLASKTHEFTIKETSAGYFPFLKIYSPKFDHWSEIHLRNYPFRSKSACQRFLQVYAQGFNLRHNLAEWLKQGGWNESNEGLELLY